MTDNSLTLTDKDGDTLTVEDARATDAGVAFLTASRNGVYLTARQARQLIDRLEPVAGPTLTALDTFNDFPLGQVFEWTDGDQRVKVSPTHYAVMCAEDGERYQYAARTTLQGYPADDIKAVS